ncbi:MAG TPA: hypothetical protein VFB38_08005 [Chthonomonadaceae bacterium]|nr:hypothetical protein [Chthonomonadaceae bacterium]
MIFKYREGERVALRYDHSVSGLKAGAEGIIWALYDIEPPAYEVTFTDSAGNQFDALMYEEELATLCQNAASLQGSNALEPVGAENEPPTT